MYKRQLLTAQQLSAVNSVEDSPSINGDDRVVYHSPSPASPPLPTISEISIVEDASLISMTIGTCLDMFGWNKKTIR